MHASFSTRRGGFLLGRHALAVLFLVIFAAGICSAALKDDEHLIFFPSYARLSENGTRWLAGVHAWVFEPELDSKVRSLAIKAFRKALELEKDEASSKIFRDRARWFIHDNEGNKRIVVKIGGESFGIGRSRSSGHVKKVLEIPDSTFSSGSPSSSWRQFSSSARDGRVFKGAVELIQPDGLSVVSDIDDTIKITEVRDKKKLLENTFLKPFRAVSGMAALYRKFQDQAISFHYVSSSPWQLYPALSDFMIAEGFPRGSFHLRTFEWRKRSFMELFSDPEKSKRAAIEPLLKAFPKRRFIMIGDSGERDPEIYGNIARDFPNQIVLILIRSVDGKTSGERFDKAFQGLPAEKHRVFDSADKLELKLPLPH